jgi:hypothetical protein
VRTSELADMLPRAFLEKLDESMIGQEAGEAKMTWKEAAVSRPCVEAASSRLSEEARAVLAAIVRRHGPGPFEEERLIAAAGKEQLREAEVRRGLSQLRGAGILFTLRKAWGDKLHFIPQDAFAPWLDVLYPARMEPAEADGKRTVRLEGGYRFPLSLQLLHGLAALAQAGLQLTNRGVLPKRTMMAMLRRLEVQDSEVKDIHVSCTQQESYERPLAIMLDAAIGLGLLRLDPEAGVIRFNADRLSDWLACRADTRERQLYDWMFERYAAYDSRYRHAAAALAMLPGGVWYLADRLEEWHRSLESEGAGLWSGWTNALCSFGWMQRGRTPDGREALRWTMEPAAGLGESTAQPASPGLLRFLPGGDMIAPPDLDYRIRWGLELLAMPASPGPMTLYRCSARTVTRFMQIGRTLADAIRLLSDAAGCAVPEDLRRMLESWAEEAATGKPAGLDKGEYRGLWPSELLQPHERREAAAFAPMREHGLVAAPFAPHLYVLEHDLPDPRPAVREAIRRLPASWLKQLREYHPTTRREMLRHAIALGAAVRIERDGGLCEFLPRTIEDADGKWLVRGMVKHDSGSEQACLTPDMWKRMQLHVVE